MLWCYSGKAAGAFAVDALVPAALAENIPTKIYPPCRDVGRGWAFFFFFDKPICGWTTS
jgi:hypothetical protein